MLKTFISFKCDACAKDRPMDLISVRKFKIPNGFYHYRHCNDIEKCIKKSKSEGKKIVEKFKEPT